MQPKEALEQLAKDCAFEYDARWFAQQKLKLAEQPENGSVVAFYKGHNIFNGVVALWGRDKRSAVLFYSTPHDIADETKYGWIPPVFRLETAQQYCYRVPKNPKAVNLAEEPEVEIMEPPVDGLANRLVHRWADDIQQRVPAVDPAFIQEIENNVNRW